MKYNDLLAQYPPASQNNSRSIILEKIKRFEKCPCERHANELEAVGITVDHLDSDFGTGPRGGDGVKEWN